ncbi:vitamin B12-binding protein precursor [bacterium BMS3Bbin14]|nr:vitamin B12-binding protein precursor [bacterium BMS3Bbin14]HDO30949.1 cobalamin-binding protein [Desulfobacteraceae bacterium]
MKNGSLSAGVVLLLLILPLTAPAAAVRAGAVRLVVDQVGRSVRVPDRPRRVVSLMPSITEEVFDLGRGALLVGVTLYAKEPPAAAALPRVGSYVNPDLERIVALRPDLCLAARDGNPADLVRRLAELNIPVFALDPQTLPAIMDSVRLLGSLLHAEKKAAGIVAAMKRKMAAVARRVAGAADRPRVFFQIDASPIVSAGSGTFIDRLITRAGGINLAAGPTAYPRFSWEDMLAMQPDVVIIASMAGGYTEKQLKAGWRQWPQIPAVRQGRLFVVDAALFDRPGPRLVDGLVRLADIFYPGGHVVPKP